MKIKTILLVILTAFVLVCSEALSESNVSDRLNYEEWDWDNETVNAFTGIIDISEWSGTELAFELKAQFEPESESAAEVIPKFTHFNGKRLPMLEQSNMIRFSPEPGQTVVEMNGSLQMPEKDHFKRIAIDLLLTGHDGKELKTVSVIISRDENNTVQTGNIFYIPFEIRTAAIIIATAALLIWCMAIIRNRILIHQKEQEK